jgi:uridine kinase
MSAPLLTPDALVTHLRALDLKDGLIAIDGWPCSGKSTLAKRICEAFGWDCLEVDDFSRPPHEWVGHAAPGYPFPFFRHDAFAAALDDLLTHRACTYHAIDWDADALQDAPKTLTRRGPMIIEGVTALAPERASGYALRIFVESDRASVFDAIFARDGRGHEHNWRTIVMPSDELYFATRPQDRADLRVAGRGIA